MVSAIQNSELLAPFDFWKAIKREDILKPGATISQKFLLFEKNCKTVQKGITIFTENFLLPKNVQKKFQVSFSTL